MSDDKFNLESISNLNLIYLYEIPYGNSVNNTNCYYGMKVVFGNNQVVEFNHKSTIFKNYLTKIYDLYHIEKNRGRNITVIGDLTKSYLEDRNFIKENDVIKIPNKIDNVNEKYSLDDVYEEQILSPFISRSINVIMSNLSGIKKKYDFVIHPGFKDRKTIFYKNEPNRQVIPMALMKKSDNVYGIKILLNIDKFYYNVNLQISFSYDEIRVYFEIKDKNIKGELKYSINYSNNGTQFLEDVLVLQNKEIIDAETNNLFINEKDEKTEKIITDFLVLSGVNFNKEGVKIYKIKEDLYFIDQITINAHTDDEDTITDVSSIVKLNGESIAIKYVISKYICKHANRLKIVLDMADVDIVYKLIHTPDEESDYVVCQKYYNQLSKANAYYTENMAGNYSDEIYLVPQNYNVASGIEKLNKIDEPEDYKRRSYMRRRANNGTK